MFNEFISQMMDCHMENESFTGMDLIFIIIGLMIAIKKKCPTENCINQQGPKNLDSFWLNSIFASLAILSITFVNYING